MAKKRDWLLFACGLSSCLLTAWTAVALVGLLRRLGYSETSAVWTSLLWAFGTLAFPYSSSLFHQVIATLLMVYVVRFAFAERVLRNDRSRRRCLISVQLTLAAAVLPLAFRDGWRPNRRSFVGLTLGVLRRLRPARAYQLASRRPLAARRLRNRDLHHADVRRNRRTLFQFRQRADVLRSVGVRWFVDAAAVRAIVDRKSAARCCSPSACHCLVVIHWWAWHGSLSWGPRLLLPVMPLMMIPIADFLERRMEVALWQRRLLGSVAAISIGINVFAATQPMIGFLNAIPNGSMSEWMFGPSFMPLAVPATFSGILDAIRINRYSVLGFHAAY